MSKQLTLSATIAVLSMATFALAVTLGDIAGIDGASLAAHSPLAQVTVSR